VFQSGQPAPAEQRRKRGRAGAAADADAAAADAGDDRAHRALADEMSTNALKGWTLRGKEHPFVAPMSWYAYAEHVGHTVDIEGYRIDPGPRSRRRQYVPLPEYHPQYAERMLNLHTMAPPFTSGDQHRRDRAPRIPFCTGWQPGGGQHQESERLREHDALAKLLLFRTGLHAPNPEECREQGLCTCVAVRSGACTCIYQELCTDKGATGRPSFSAQLKRLGGEWRDRRQLIDRWERERRRVATLGGIWDDPCAGLAIPKTDRWDSSPWTNSTLCFGHSGRPIRTLPAKTFGCSKNGCTAAPIPHNQTKGSYAYLNSRLWGPRSGQTYCCPACGIAAVARRAPSSRNTTRATT